MHNPFTLEGKTILVTGASSGIGRVTAIECSKLGARVILTGRNEERLIEIVNSLFGLGHEYYLADLSDYGQLAEMVSHLPKLDGFVNNAGIGRTLPIQFLSIEEIEKIFRVNNFAPMLLTKELVKKKKLVNPSSIVFTLSIAGNYNVLPGNSMYGNAKTGLSAFVKYAALELAGKGIRCNAVSPGMVNTELIKNLPVSQDDLQRDMQQYPLKRYAEPEEIAYAIIYLLSDASSFVTGSNLVIDGGRSLK